MIQGYRKINRIWMKKLMVKTIYNIINKNNNNKGKKIMKMRRWGAKTMWAFMVNKLTKKICNHMRINKWMMTLNLATSMLISLI